MIDVHCHPLAPIAVHCQPLPPIAVYCCLLRAAINGNGQKRLLEKDEKGLPNGI